MTTSTPTRPTTGHDEEAVRVRLAEIEAELASERERIRAAARSRDDAAMSNILIASVYEQMGMSSPSGARGMARVHELQAERSRLQGELAESGIRAKEYPKGSEKEPSALREAKVERRSTAVACSSCHTELRKTDGGLFQRLPGLEQWLGNVCVACKQTYCPTCIQVGAATPCPKCQVPTKPAQRHFLEEAGLLSSSSPNSSRQTTPRDHGPTTAESVDLKAVAAIHCPSCDGIVALGATTCMHCWQKLPKLSAVGHQVGTQPWPIGKLLSGVTILALGALLSILTIGIWQANEWDTSSYLLLGAAIVTIALGFVCSPRGWRLVTFACGLLLGAAVVLMLAADAPPSAPGAKARHVTQGLFGVGAAILVLRVVRRRPHRRKT